MFGEYLKNLREFRGYSIETLSRKSGVSGAHISRVENGKRSVPSPLTIRKLSKALKEPYLKMLHAAGYIDLELLNPGDNAQPENTAFDDFFKHTEKINIGENEYTKKELFEAIQLSESVRKLVEQEEKPKK